jgi:hypothetical protein
MPKVLKAYNTDYIIAARPGGKIFLDTGFNEGDVVVTGNLEVRGNTTTVDTTELIVEDNIIQLSSGTVGSGLSPAIGSRSGIEINRGGDIEGNNINAYWVYDEDVNWDLGGLSSDTLGAGTFYAEINGQKLPLNTPGIKSEGDFYIDTGFGVISVTNTVDYEKKIFNYDGDLIAPNNLGRILIEDDSIPNAKAVKDVVDYYIENKLQDIIQEGNTSVETFDEFHNLLSIVSVSPQLNSTTIIRTQGPHGFSIGDTVNISGIEASGDPIENLNGFNIPILEVLDTYTLRVDADSTGGDIELYISNTARISKDLFLESRVSIRVDGNNTANFFSNRTQLGDLEIIDSQILSTDSNADIILKSQGVGSVKIDDVLEITSLPYEGDENNPPLASPDGIKIYTADQRGGKTGIFFVNKDNTRDEIISKNRSLLFSMLF